MRLSDVKGERTLDVIADIIDFVANIAESDAGKALLKREKLPDGADRRKATIGRIKATIPKLLKDNKKDIISIMATIEGKSYDEFVENLNMANFLADLNELVSDSTFVELFMQAQTGKPSGSAQENTEAR